MSFKEVKELRINGKLEEALILANSDLASDPSNVWNIRSISWVYYDFLKSNTDISNFITFNEYLDKILSLEQTVDDAIMLHENVAIQIGKLVYNIFKEKEVDFEKIDKLKTDIALKPYLKAFIGRDAFNKDAYYPIINKNDKCINKAIEELSK